MKRMRTIKEALAEIKAVDPKTCLTEFCIRQLVLSGACPSFKAGRKYLIDLDALLGVLGGDSDIEPKPEEVGGFFEKNRTRKIEA